jgi:hypothetical protein
MMIDKLIFGLGNAKLAKNIATLSLPAGFTCPFAKECLSKACKETGKIKDGEHCKYRCFAASQECGFPSVRKNRWDNFELLQSVKGVEATAKLIQRSLPTGIGAVRIHVSGDYYNETYFLAWLNVALNNPLITFYGYTKALPLMVKYKRYIPTNFKLTASKGGTHDHLIIQHKLKYAEVVFSVEQAEKLGLEIDHDDSHAYGSKKSFALLIHGCQPAGTEAGEALKALKKKGIGGYGDAKDSRKVTFEKELIVYISVNNGKITLPNKRKKVIVADLNKSIVPAVHIVPVNIKRPMAFYKSFYANS